MGDELGLTPAGGDAGRVSGCLGRCRRTQGPGIEILQVSAEDPQETLFSEVGNKC